MSAECHRLGSSAIRELYLPLDGPSGGFQMGFLGAALLQGWGRWQLPVYKQQQHLAGV